MEPSNNLSSINGNESKDVSESHIKNSPEPKRIPSRHSLSSDVPMGGSRRPSFLCLNIPDRNDSSSSFSSSWRGSLSHLGLPSFTLTSPDGDTGRKFSFGLGLRRHSHNTLHKTESMVSLCFQSLISFVNSDNLPGLQSFLETKQLQIDDRDENGTTALMVAASKGKGVFVRELLAHGADPNAEDNDNWTALLCASKEGHYDIVLQLLEHNAEIDHRDIGGWTALMWATYKGHTNIAIHLLDRGAEVNAHGNYHISSLLWAAGRGHLEITKALINHGAKVNVGDKYGTTALVWASRKGYTEIVELLLRAGANVDTAGMYSWTPLIVATSGNHVDVMNLLLEHKPNVNALDKDGCSPLTIACKEGYYEIATALLAAGAYINIQDRVGDTNLIHAVKGGHKNVVEALLKKYADVDIVGKDKKSAVYVAVEKGNVNIVKLLLNQNPDLESATKDGDTPLLKAVRNRNAEIVQILLEKKAKVSATDKKGDTALHIAMRARSKAIVEILLRNPKHSQLLYRPNRAGETPYNIDLNHPKTILGQIFGARRLNTNEDNENMLGYDLYSSALADILSEPSLSMPITVGLYAKWGSGKSFLLTKLREEMKNFAREWVDPVFQFTSLLFLIIFHLSIIVATTVYIIIEATTEDLQPEIWSFGIAIGFFILCFMFLAFVWFASKSYDWDWPYNFNVNLTRKMNNIKLVLEILFCHPPGVSSQDGISVQPIRFYFTDQTRVSSTTGGENSVVQMIGSLYDSIESHYGTLATRLYRAFKPKPVKSSSTWTWRKMCCLPYVVIFEITFCMIVIGVSALTFYLRRVTSEEPDSASIAKPTLEIILIVAALLLAVATIANAYTWSKLLMSVLFSQRRHLQRSISKLDTLKSEGFLQTLRQEVNLMKDMVKCLDGLSAQQTRLVIVVDGLDSCEQEKVLLILDTVHMLFSDANSPFIVILAIDPHVIAKAVEINSRRLFTESNIGGHSYLNNMVHLPFYLQNSGLRKVKVAQQTSASHRKVQATSSAWSENDEHLNTFLARSSSSRRLSSENTLVSASRENLKYAGARKGSRKLKLSDSIASSIGSNLNRIGGAQDLTKMLLTDDYFSDVNPRSMRRLMNVVYVTGRLLKAFQIDFNWYRLASWINITEQWPFRTSWIIYHYDLYEDQLEDNTPLKSIYDKIRPLIPSIKDSEPLLELDRDEKKFDIFLTFHRSSLLVSDLKIFLPFTINLDPYLKKVIKEETQMFEEDGIFMSAIRPSPYSSLAQPSVQAWNNHFADWSGTPTRHFMAPSSIRERRQGVIGMSKVGPPPGIAYPQTGPVAPTWPQFDPMGSVSSVSRPPPGLPPVTILEPEILNMKLSTLNVDGVCKLLSTMDDLSQSAVPEYIRLIKENNINGRVLLHCDLDDLKKLLHMSFGDWEMFKVTLIQLREYEITSILRQDEVTQPTVRKPERKGSIKATNSGVDKTDSKLQADMPRERKQSVIEKQVTLEEQMICGALQTLNEEACEDVLEETEETKITIDQDLPQTSVIPPSPDCPQDIQTVPTRGYRSRTNSSSGIGETDFVLLQSSPIGHMHWQPVSITIAGYSESLSDHSSRCSSQPPSPVQERRYSQGNKSSIKFAQEVPNKENRGRHVVIKTDSDTQRVSISSNNSTVVYENYSNKPIEQSQSKSRPNSLTLVHKDSKPHKLALRSRSKSIDNSNNIRRTRAKEKITGLDKLQRFREKLLQSSPDLNETSDNESTPLVSEVSSPSNKSGQSSEPKSSDSIPVSPTSQKSLSPDKDLRKHTRSEQNLTDTPDYSPFHPPLSDNDAYGCDKTNNHGPSDVDSPERCRIRSRTLSGESDSSLTGFLSNIQMNEDVTNSNCSLQSLSHSSGHLSRQNAIDSEEDLTDVYCNPARIN